MRSSVSTKCALPIDETFNRLVRTSSSRRIEIHAEGIHVVERKDVRSWYLYLHCRALDHFLGKMRSSSRAVGYTSFFWAWIFRVPRVRIFLFFPCAHPDTFHCTMPAIDASPLTIIFANHDPALSISQDFSSRDPKSLRRCSGQIRRRCSLLWWTICHKFLKPSDVDKKIKFMHTHRFHYMILKHGT